MNYSGMKVSQLKALCRERSIETTGMLEKSELVEALENPDPLRAVTTSSGKASMAPISPPTPLSSGPTVASKEGSDDPKHRSDVPETGRADTVQENETSLMYAANAEEEEEHEETTLSPIKQFRLSAKEFLEGYPHTGWTNEEFIQNGAFRGALCRELHKFPTAPHKKFLPLVREMLREETRFQRYGDNAYSIAFFLYQIGELEDLVELWDAKWSSQDMGSVVDPQFFVGNGVERTIEYLRKQEDCEDIVEFLTESRDNGYFDDLEGWLERQKELHN